MNSRLFNLDYALGHLSIAFPDYPEKIIALIDHRSPESCDRRVTHRMDISFEDNVPIYANQLEFEVLIGMGPFDFDIHRTPHWLRIDGSAECGILGLTNLFPQNRGGKNQQTQQAQEYQQKDRNNG